MIGDKGGGGEEVHNVLVLVLILLCNVILCRLFLCLVGGDFCHHLSGSAPKLGSISPPS